MRAARLMDDVANRIVLDAVMRGTIPANILARLGRFFPRSLEQDLPWMKRRDLCRHQLLHAQHLPLVMACSLFPTPLSMSPRARSAAPCGIYPPGITSSLERLKDEYGNPPCIITENGFPLPDAPGVDPLDDAARIDYLSSHIALVGRAIADGADCRGYFHFELDG